MRVVIVLCTLLIAGLAPAAGIAQMLPAHGALPPAPSFGGMGLPSLLPSSSRSCGQCDPDGMGGLQVIPGIKAGVQRLSASVSVPIPETFVGNFNRFNFETMDASVNDATLWVGGVSLVAAVPDAFVVFAEAVANAERNVLVETNFAGDVASAGFVSPWEWTGSDIEWWTLDFGAWVNIQRGWGLVGGFRFEHNDVHLRDPRNVNGSIAGQMIYDSERRAGDLQVKLWIPYFGIGGMGPNFKWSLVGVPFAWARVEMPIRWITTFAGANDFSDSRYRVTVGGARFIELNGVYFANLAHNFKLDFWFKASWFGVDGRGNLDSTADLEDTIIFGQSGSADTGDARVSRNIISGGIAASLAF